MIPVFHHSTSTFDLPQIEAENKNTQYRESRSKQQLVDEIGTELHRSHTKLQTSKNSQLEQEQKKPPQILTALDLHESRFNHGALLWLRGHSNEPKNVWNECYWNNHSINMSLTSLLWWFHINSHLHSCIHVHLISLLLESSVCAQQIPSDNELQLLHGLKNVSQPAMGRVFQIS